MPTPSRVLSRPLWIKISLVVVFGGLVGLLWWAWKNFILVRSELAAEQLARRLAVQMAMGSAVDVKDYESFLREEPNVVYLVIANYQFRHPPCGKLVLRNLSRGAQELEEHWNRYGERATLKRLAQRGGGFPGEYLQVVSATFLPSDESMDRTPMGILKVGFLVPGKIKGFPPLGRGFSYLLYASWTFCGLMAVGFLVSDLSTRRRTRSKEKSSALFPKEIRPALSFEPGISWLKESQEQEDPICVTPEGQTWRILVSGQEVGGWKIKGHWSILGGELTGHPWGASMVRMNLPMDASYVYQLQARKITGPDGFVVLFPWKKLQLAWILGGWKNTRSEVAGHGGTVTPYKVERGQWYAIEINASADGLEGYINGEINWSLSASEAVLSSPEIGFQKGLGFGVWNTLARFRDIRFRLQ